MDEPVHVWEDSERLNDPEAHEKEEEAIEVLDELLVTAQLVEVRVGLAEILQVELVLQLVAHDDRHHS